MENNDIRLFTKIRNEFNKWSKVIEKNFQEGECRVPSRTWHFGRRWRTREAGAAAGEGGGSREVGTREPRLLCPMSLNSGQ